MISGWKIRRELARFGQQLRGIGEKLTDPAKQRKLNRVVAAGLPQFDGALPLTTKVALFLVYQPKGISPSTLETCRTLSNAGYTPLIVSNCPLSANDQELLRPFIWRAVERPNFGYDFGGYRDGLICLKKWDVAPEELLILNDSIWFPVLPDADLWDRLAQETSDIAGTILRERGAERFLESYLFRIRRPALEHPAFAAYWADLQLTSNKYHVIRRGERGFSAAMRAGGIGVAGVYDDKALPERVAKQDDDFLRQTLRFAAYIDTGLAEQSAQLLADGGQDWRAAVLAHIHKVMEKRQGYSSFPYANMCLTGYPILKKSGEPVSKAWRLAYLNALNANAITAPSQEILQEIKARDTQR